MTQYPLGRNVRHDPRSLQYKAPVTGTIKSVEWTRHIPILDQGQLGSCTGNAGTGLLGSDGIYQTLTSVVTSKLNEAYAIQLYSDATKVDDDPDHYPPTDTGSNGLSIAQVLKTRGLISGYTHITSLAAAHTAIQTGPFITGTSWYNGMFEPDPTGLVTISGALAGGHEYEAIGYDVDRGRWKFANSWGTSFGDDGYMYMTDATYARLLAEQGDATVLVPINEPAPVPTPAPAPATNAWPAAAVDPWLATRQYTAKGKAAQAALKAYETALTQ